MIPRTVAPVCIDVRADGLRRIDAESVVEGIACLHGYESSFYAAATSERAERCVASELETLRQIDGQAGSREAFDALAFAVESDCFDLQRLELGA